MDALDDLTGLYLPEKVLLGARRDRVVRAIGDADRRYLKFVCPVYTFTDDLERRRFDQAALEGSATAVTFEGKFLLLTAAHVVRDEAGALRRLGIVLDGYLESLPATPLYTSVGSDDFAILDVGPDIARRLTGVTFLSLPEGMSVLSDPTAEQLTFVGFPCSRNKVSYRSMTIPPLEATSVHATGVTRRDRTCFRARFDPRTATNESGVPGCPDLHGLSGGPVLQHLVSGDAVSTRLFGITFELDHDELVGHHLRYILAGWSARPSLAPPEE